MNRYYEDDFENALECMRVMKYAQKTVNLLIYAEWCLQLDMFDDFERNPDFPERTFIKKYMKTVYKTVKEKRRTLGV